MSARGGTKKDLLQVISGLQKRLADLEAARASHKPKMLTCRNCRGKKWFPSAIGEISCQMCGGTGDGGIDVDWLLSDWQRLKQAENLTAMLCSRS